MSIRHGGRTAGRTRRTWRARADPAGLPPSTSCGCASARSTSPGTRAAPALGPSGADRRTPPSSRARRGSPRRASRTRKSGPPRRCRSRRRTRRSRYRSKHPRGFSDGDDQSPPRCGARWLRAAGEEDGAVRAARQRRVLGAARAASLLRLARAVSSAPPRQRRARLCTRRGACASETRRRRGSRARAPCASAVFAAAAPRGERAEIAAGRGAARAERGAAPPPGTKTHPSRASSRPAPRRTASSSHRSRPREREEALPGPSAWSFSAVCERASRRRSSERRFRRRAPLSARSLVPACFVRLRGGRGRRAGRLRLLRRFLALRAAVVVVRPTSRTAALTSARRRRAPGPSSASSRVGSRTSARARAAVMGVVRARAVAGAAVVHHLVPTPRARSWSCRSSHRRRTSAGSAAPPPATSSARPRACARRGPLPLRAAEARGGVVALLALVAIGRGPAGGRVERSRRRSDVGWSCARSREADRRAVAGAGPRRARKREKRAALLTRTHLLVPSASSALAADSVLTKRQRGRPRSGGRSPAPSWQRGRLTEDSAARAWIPSRPARAR